MPTYSSASSSVARDRFSEWSILVSIGVMVGEMNQDQVGLRMLQHVQNRLRARPVVHDCAWERWIHSRDLFNQSRAWRTSSCAAISMRPALPPENFSGKL